MKKITLLAMSLMMTLFVKAQSGVDITSQLTNSDFEDGSTGWSITGGFATIATAETNGYHGTSFMEDWTAAPGTLADLDCSQTITVENGLYVVTALAHAIQQDNSSLDIVGIDIYANKDASMLSSAIRMPRRKAYSKMAASDRLAYSLQQSWNFSKISFCSSVKLFSKSS